MPRITTLAEDVKRETTLRGTNKTYMDWILKTSKPNKLIWIKFSRTSTENYSSNSELREFSQVEDTFRLGMLLKCRSIVRFGYRGERPFWISRRKVVSTGGFDALEYRRLYLRL